jgi:uncharacterized protein involved in outer membrane biogenesis
MKKPIKVAIVVVIGIIVVALAIAYINLDSIIRSTVESQGTQQLQVATKLGGVNLSLFGGSLTLKDFSLGSPKGFSEPQMLALGQADVKVSLSGLRGEPKHISTITLDKPKLVIEQNGLNLNFKALADQLPKSDAPAQPQPAESGETMKLIIDQLNINGAEVVLKGNLPGLSQSLTIPIPDLAMQNIGNAGDAKNGAAIKDVVMDVVTAMVAKAADSDKVPPALKTLLKGNLADVGAQLGTMASDQITKQLGEGVGAAAGDVLKGKPPTTQDLGNAAGDLMKQFGKKKDKK